jgi:hypothetical protein
MYLHKSLDENGIEKKLPIFEAGDIVYFINYDRKVPKISRHYRVDIGIVYDDWFYTNEVKVSLLVPKEDRLVNGVSWNEFKTPTKVMPLVSNDRKLKPYEIYNKYVHITHEKTSIFYKDIDISNRDEIVKYVLSKDLIPLVERDNSYISFRYDDSGKGYYLTREYDPYVHPFIYISKYYSKYVWENEHKLCYSDTFSIGFNYNKIKTLCDKLNELQILHKEKIDNMTELDFVIEEIDDVCGKYNKIYCDDIYYTRAVKQWLLAKKNADKLCVRLYCGDIQWKYSQNSKWQKVDKDEINTIIFMNKRSREV